MVLALCCSALDGQRSDMRSELVTSGGLNLSGTRWHMRGGCSVKGVRKFRFTRGRLKALTAPN